MLCGKVWASPELVPVDGDEMPSVLIGHQSVEPTFTHRMRGTIRFIVRSSMCFSLKKKLSIRHHLDQQHQSHKVVVNKNQGIRDTPVARIRGWLPAGFILWLAFGSPAQLYAKEQIVDFPQNMDQKRNRNVPIKFHLPKERTAQPVVVISHGAGGSRDGMFALAQEIAKQGYVVMCLEHVTSNTDNIRERMKAKRWGFRNAVVASGKDISARRNRPLDVKFAIDLATKLNLEDSNLKGRMDLSRIAMIGHSYGAYTTLVCCGAKPVGIQDQLADARVKLGIVMSPQAGNGEFFDATSFQAIKVPFMGISGNRDRTQFVTSVKDREDCFRSMPPGDKHFVWFDDAGHFSFSDSSGSGRKVLLKPDSDVTNALKRIVPSILDVHLRGTEKLDAAARNQLVDASLAGSVKRIEWKTR